MPREGWPNTSRIVIVLGVIVLGLLALNPRPALAHDLEFDSDLDENGIIQVANPEDITPGALNDAIDDWNTQVQNGLEQGPIIVDVTNNPDAFVEVVLDKQGGQDANFYGRTVFSVHPDNIDLSERFWDLGYAKRVGTLTHELGHTRGHAHAGAAYCSTSVMPTRGTCADAGDTRRETVGGHDVHDEGVLWYDAGATHPVHNKCWTNVDADGDRHCDKYGPPPVGDPVYGQPTEPPGLLP